MTDTDDASWVTRAIAEEEEHIKRSKACLERPGRLHAFRAHGHPARPDEVVSRCVVCGVTRTAQDYHLTE